MAGTDTLPSVKVGERFHTPIPPGGAALEVFDADGVRTIVIDSAGLLVSALTATSITYGDDIVGSYGTGNDARLSWDTTDGNANELLLQLPAGGAVNVPVIVIGQAIESVNLGLYDGVVNPRIAIFGVGAVATGAVLEFRKARGSVASPTVVTSGDDLGSLDFYGAVASGEYVRSAQILAELTGTVATTRGPGVLTFLTATDAAPSVLTIAMRLNANQSASFGGAILPVSSDLAALGSATLMWADLFLASGGVINFDNGDVVMTHTANALAITGGTTTLSAAITTGNHTFSLTITAGADGVGADGEQLTSGGAAAECDWAAAGSLREFKRLVGMRDDAAEVLAMIAQTPVYDFQYLSRDEYQGGFDHPITTGDNKTQYVGVMADEAPWAMHHDGRILNPVNALGYTVLAIKGLLARIEDLEQRPGLAAA